MNTQTTKQQELFFLWIQGSIIKLTELGLGSVESPKPLTNEEWEKYKEVDENRDLIPDIALEAIFKTLDPDFSQNIQNLVWLLCQYKNNRTEFMRHSLEILMDK
jgi:hypothetical protein